MSLVANTFVGQKIRSYFAVHPIKSQSLLAGFLWALGDLISQRYIERDVDEDNPNLVPNEGMGRVMNLNWKRVGTMLIYGTLIQGPMNYYWYRALSKHVDGKYGARKTKEIFHKVCVDQFFMGPTQLILYITFCTTVEKMLNRKQVTAQAVGQKINSKFMNMFLVDLSIWPMIQSLNFAFVNPKYQSVVVNSVSVGYNAILTYIQHHLE
jgi:protein Mpv17